MTGSVVWRVTRGWLLLLLFGAFFAIPLLSMLDFSTQGAWPASVAPARPGATWWRTRLSPKRSPPLLLSLFTVVMMIALLVPTMIWVQAKYRERRAWSSTSACCR